MGIESLLDDVIKGGPGSGRTKLKGADPRDQYRDKESKEAKIKRRLAKEREAMQGGYLKFKGGFFIDIEKGGPPYEMTDEVGQTGSGESIYGDFTNDKHESFSDDDHSDAAKEHMKIVSSHLANAVGDDADPKYSGMMRYHLKQARLHQGASENEKQKGNPGMKQKSLGRAFDDIIKAEGSRGGKVIGHTRSGKPIYSTPNNSQHSDFNSSDHHDAMAAHHNLFSSTPGKAADKHQRHASTHGFNTQEKEPSYSDKEGQEKYKQHGKDIVEGKYKDVNPGERKLPKRGDIAEGNRRAAAARHSSDQDSWDRATGNKSMEASMFKTNMPDSLIKGGPGNRILAISELDVGNYTDSPASIIDDQIQKGFAHDDSIQKGCATKKSEEKEEEPAAEGEGTEPTVADEEINKKSLSGVLDDIIKGGPDKVKPKTTEKSFGSENLKNTHGENWHSDADKMVVDYLTSVDKVNPYDESHNQLQHIDPDRPQHVQDRSMLVITR